jgi:hypothetical protein
MHDIAMRRPTFIREDLYKKYAKPAKAVMALSENFMVLRREDKKIFNVRPIKYKEEFSLKDAKQKTEMFI